MCKESLQHTSMIEKSSISEIAHGMKTISSGFDQNRHLIEIGLFTVSTLYGTVYYLNPDIVVNPVLCPEEIEHGECRRPDLIAYKVVCMACMVTMGLIGVYHWHFTPEFKRLGSKEATPEERLFSPLKASKYLNTVIFSYQFFDFVISLMIPEHNDIIFLAHHLLALLTAYFSLEYQMVAYYSIFYGGCSEFSSIFLIFLDKQEVIPIPRGSLLENWVQVCQVMFFLTFSYYRVYGWIRYSFPLWRDCQAVIESGSVEKHRPGKAYFLRIFQGLDFTLGALQVYWYYKILGMVARMVST